MLGLGASAYRGGAEILSNCRFWPQHVHQKLLKLPLCYGPSRLPNQIPLRIFVHRAIRQLAAPRSEICHFGQAPNPGCPPLFRGLRVGGVL